MPVQNLKLTSRGNGRLGVAVLLVVTDRKDFFCIRGADLDRLTEGDLGVIDNWLRGSLVTPALKTPRPHQAEALDAILEGLERPGLAHHRGEGVLGPPLKGDARGVRPPARDRDPGPLLAPGGRLLMEIGPRQAAPVGRILADAGLAVTAVLPDLDGRDRVVSVEI